MDGEFFFIRIEHYPGISVRPGCLGIILSEHLNHVLIAVKWYRIDIGIIIGVEAYIFLRNGIVISIAADFDGIRYGLYYLVCLEALVGMVLVAIVRRRGILNYLIEVGTRFFLFLHQFFREELLYLRAFGVVAHVSDPVVYLARELGIYVCILSQGFYISGFQYMCLFQIARELIILSGSWEAVD